MATHGKIHWKFLLLAGLLVYIAGSALFSFSFSIGPNYRNVSVDTTVNITQSLPTVLNVIIYDNVSTGTKNITLNAGTWKNITCNSTVQDYNGGSTIDNISAVFYDNISATPTSADDNNTHYSNTNCTLGAFDATTRNVSCSFLVQYYANTSMWTCNVTATDDYNFANASRSQSLVNGTHLDALLALNVTPLIDYGNLAVGDLSTPQIANVTNFGNLPINVSVRGYGTSTGDGLAMVCQVGNITVQNEKYNLIGGTDLSTYTNLTNSTTRITGLTVAHQINDSQIVINSTYWLLYVPPNPFGRCNGTVVFQAELS